MSFELASRVFFDRFALTEQTRIGGKQSWRTIGLVEDVAALGWPHAAEHKAEGSDLIRITSARRAD